MKKTPTILLLLLMLWAAAVPAYAAVNASGVPEIAGVVIYADSWTPLNMPYGVYSLPWAGRPSLKEHVSGDEYNAYNGGVYADGKLLTIAPGAFAGVRYRVHDTDTWELLSDQNSWTDFKAISMAADPESGDIYCCYYDADYEQYYWGTFSLTDFETSRLGYLDDDYFNALAFAPDGTLYAITDKGMLVKVNPARGSYTAIGDTGLRPGGISSAVYDPASAKLYYALSSETKSALYTVDPVTAAATHIYDMPDGEQIVAAYFPKAEAAAGAPAVATGLEADFPAGAMSGRLRFTVPATTFGGAAATGDVTYTVSVDKAVAATGTAAVGTEQSVQLTIATAGPHEFAVTLTNAAGTSPEASLSAFIGHDVPAPVKGLSSSYDGSAFTLSWEAAAGQNGGYMTPGAVTYTVRRYPDGSVVKDGITSTSYVDAYPEPTSLVSVYHTVTATYGGVTTAPVSTAPQVVGCLTPPYSESFAERTGFDPYTVIDNNDDRNTWQWARGYVRYTYTQSKAADDYLVLPGMKLTAGLSYTFAFDARCEDAADAERVAVYAGTAPEVAALTTEVVAPTTVAHTSYKTLEGVFVPPASGTYYFAVKACSDPYKYYLYVTNISVSAPASAAVPAAVGSMAAVPADFGELSADVSFTAPALDIAGSPLASIDKVEIYLNDVLAETVSATPGQSVVRSIAVPSAGDYTFRAVAYNAHGAGLSAEASCYVGLTLPRSPEFISAIQGDNDGQMILSWAPVQRDTNGTRMDPSQVSYTLYRTEGSKTEMLKSGLRVTSYTDQAVEAGASQKFVQYSVEAVNPQGAGERASTGLEIVGESYKLPYTESVPDGRLTHPLGMSWPADRAGEWSLATDRTYRDVESQDGDGGYLTFTGDRDAGGSIYTGRISLRGSSRPTLTFYYNTYGGSDNLNSIEVSVSTGSGYTPLQSVTMSGDRAWRKCSVDLSRYIGREIQVMFTALAATHRAISIDNIRIADLLDHDLALVSAAVPVGAVGGRELTLTATVANVGSQAASGYTVELVRDGSAVASAEGKSLDPDAVTEYKLSDAPSTMYGAEVTYTVRIVYEADLNADNDCSADLDVALATPLHPVPTALAARASGSADAELTWTAPQLEGRVIEPVTDGAEDYTSFSIGLPGSALADDNMGEWTVIDRDGKLTIGAKNAANQMLDYPNARAAMSFQVFNPLALGLDAPAWATRSGERMWICFSALGAPNDDWLISPELSGAAQTVSLYARSASALYGLESMEILASSTGRAVENFTPVATVAEVPGEWTRLTCDLPEGTRHFAIRCTSDDKYALCIDDISMVTAAAAGVGLELLGYHVYCDGDRLNTAIHTGESYTHAGVPAGKSVEYNVTAVYNMGESAPSETVLFAFSGLGDAAVCAPSIAVEGRDIVVSGADADAVCMICGADGRTVYTGRGDVRRTVAPGVYVVRCGVSAVKVYVR